MKYNKKTQKHINIFYLTIYIPIFLSFSLNCTQEIKQEKENHPSIEKESNHTFFVSGGDTKKLSLYSDKFSSKISLLGIFQNQGVNRAFHIEYILSAISRNSLEETEKILSKKIPRYTIREKVILGNFSKSERQGLFDFTANIVLTRSYSDVDLVALLSNLQKVEYSQFPIQEKILFKPKKNFQLWKAEEWSLEGGNTYIWRNFEEDSILLAKIPYTEYISTIGVTYSKINTFDDYIYSLYKGESVPLFSFFDFTIVSKLEDGTNLQAPIKGKLKEAGKNSLPKLFLVKILNSNGN
ncbi:MAG: hypothetical protein EBS19_05735 [Spirochaetia bacterium]|nr:hypothetical protein [Spirochaetia bacterium]